MHTFDYIKNKPAKKQQCDVIKNNSEQSLQSKEMAGQNLTRNKKSFYKNAGVSNDLQNDLELT